MREVIGRRAFLIMSAKGAGAAVISYGLMGCAGTSKDDIPVEFLHGVASGDPLQDSVILWTRVTPSAAGEITVSWEIAKDENFVDLVGTGSTLTSATRDYTVKVDAQGLAPGTNYFYRFISGNKTSPVGKTKTLVTGSPQAVKFAVMSCANYPAGFFNVYDLAAKQDDFDAVLHLGDYIYEHDRGGYASEHAEQLGRQVLPANELLTLADYRTRHGQYRGDASLQMLHAKVPFIAVWDDHEIANDTWREGAENHNEGEGDFDARKLAALQAYFEWLPLRPLNSGSQQEIYRSFRFGDLVDLHMLDTRVIGRDKQLDYADFISGTGELDTAAFTAASTDSTRTLLGAKQFQWLQNTVAQSTGRWQVLGQQILMGKMLLPAAIALQLMSVSEYAELAALAQLVARAKAGDPMLTDEELAYINANSAKLTDDVIAKLTLPSIPYNLDAWDGYDYERELVLQLFKQNAKNLVVLAGDTHNAWANNLHDKDGDVVGVEFATASVSSPGLEKYLSIPTGGEQAFEAGLVSLVAGLKYLNASNRGYLTLTFTQTNAIAEWTFVDTILSKTYTPLSDRQARAETTAGSPAVKVLSD